MISPVMNPKYQDHSRRSGVIKNIVDIACLVVDDQRDAVKRLQLRAPYLVALHAEKKRKEAIVDSNEQKYNELKRDVKELMEQCELKSAGAGPFIFTIAEKRSVEVTDLAAFMRWSVDNLSPEVRQELFTPKASVLSKVVSDAYEEKDGIDKVLFKIPGIETNKITKILTIKESKR